MAGDSPCPHLLLFYLLPIRLFFCFSFPTLLTVFSFLPKQTPAWAPTLNTTWIESVSHLPPLVLLFPACQALPSVSYSRLCIWPKQGKVPDLYKTVSHFLQAVRVIQKTWRAYPYGCLNWYFGIMQDQLPPYRGMCLLSKPTKSTRCSHISMGLWDCDAFKTLLSGKQNRLCSITRQKSGRTCCLRSCICCKFINKIYSNWICSILLFTL